jgi:protein DJ-1
VEQERSGGIIAAICAAPTVLASAGVGKGKRLTSYPAPAIRTLLESHGCYREERVVRDGQLLTSRGPGTAFEFALALLEMLQGEEVARRVAAGLLLPDGLGWPGRP